MRLSRSSGAERPALLTNYCDRVAHDALVPSRVRCFARRDPSTSPPDISHLPRESGSSWPPIQKGRPTRKCVFGPCRAWLSSAGCDGGLAGHLVLDWFARRLRSLGLSVCPPNGTPGLRPVRHPVSCRCATEICRFSKLWA